MALYERQVSQLTQQKEPVIRIALNSQHVPIANHYSTQDVKLVDHIAK